jgi:xanthine dehydrogenase FAD-binding subunit
MIRQNFDFIKPDSLKEALAILAQGDSNIRPIAGGTDFIPGLHQDSQRFNRVKKLVDINSLSELRQIAKIKTGLSIGAAVTFSDIEKNKIILKKYPLLTKAVSTIGSRQIRNRATIAGNFVNNAPCADSVPALLVYEAKIKIRTANKSRIIGLEDFLVKPYQTQLQPGELVTEILLPPPPAGVRGDFYKLGRRRGVAISRITLAVLLKQKNRKIEAIRIAAGAVTPIGKRFPGLEALAAGMDITDHNLKELAQKLGEQILEHTGLRWSSPYKLPVTQQMFYQLLKKLCSKY